MGTLSGLIGFLLLFWNSETELNYNIFQLYVRNRIVPLFLFFPFSLSKGRISKKNMQTKQGGSDANRYYQRHLASGPTVALAA
jgi:hypothetical protein